MSPLHEAVSRIGSLRLAHGQALELPDELLPCCGPDGCGHSSAAAGGDATSSRLSQWLRALALPTALMTSGSAAATATSGAGAGAGASSVSPAESADATAKRCNRRHLHAPSAAALRLSGKLGVELLAMAVAGLAQQWLVLALLALLVLFELAQVSSDASEGGGGDEGWRGPAVRWVAARHRHAWLLRACCGQLQHRRYNTARSAHSSHQQLGHRQQTCSCVHCN